MYEAFYGLSEKPFSILPDPDYLYLGEQHSLAYTMLQYGVEQRAGFTVVTGDIGCGKTSLIRHLLNDLHDDVTVGLISNTQQEAGELLKWVLLAFDQPYDGSDRIALFDQLTQFLIRQYAEGRRTVLIIDEAQNLAGDTLEELRMLSNINADKDLLLQLVLVGQPGLKDLLQRPELEQFTQRISADFHLSSLNRDEVPNYIVYRLAVAGRDAMLFDEGAMARITEVSGAVPRKINILCDTALVYAFSQEAELVTRKIIDEVVHDKARYGVFSDTETPVQEPSPQLVVGKPKSRNVKKLRDEPLDRNLARQLFSTLADKK